MKQVTVLYVLNPLFARNQTISVNSKNFKEHITKGKERLLKNHTNRQRHTFNDTHIHIHLMTRKFIKNKVNCKNYFIKIFM